MVLYHKRKETQNNIHSAEHIITQLKKIIIRKRRRKKNETIRTEKKFFFFEKESHCVREQLVSFMILL